MKFADFKMYVCIFTVHTTSVYNYNFFILKVQFNLQAPNKHHQSLIEVVHDDMITFLKELNDSIALHEK